MSIYPAHSMCYRLSAERDMLEKMTASSAMMAREKIPPVKVLKSGSS